MTLPNWFTVAKWVGLGAVVLAIIAIPVWYVNKMVDEAFENGKVVGITTCQEQRQIENSIELKKKEEIIYAEAQRANRLERKNENLERKAKSLEEQLVQELEKEPVPSICMLGPESTNSLRDFAEGKFSLEADEGDSVPKQHDEKVPDGASVPEKRADNFT